MLSREAPWITAKKAADMAEQAGKKNQINEVEDKIETLSADLERLEHRMNNSKTKLQRTYWEWRGANVVEEIDVNVRKYNRLLVEVGAPEPRPPSSNPSILWRVETTPHSTHAWPFPTA